jgi:hypothetical protein
MIRRKVQKVSAEMKKSYRKGMRKYLICKECNLHEVLVSFEIGAVTCGNCVQKMVGAPAGITPKSPDEKFPRGWALKARYVHTDGRVFERGKATDEIVQAEPKVVRTHRKVKTKKSVTRVIKKKKTSKRT